MHARIYQANAIAHLGEKIFQVIRWYIKYIIPRLIINRGVSRFWEKSVIIWEKVRKFRVLEFDQKWNKNGNVWDDQIWRKNRNIKHGGIREDENSWIIIS